MKLKHKFALSILSAGVIVIGVLSVVYYYHFIRIATKRHLDILQADTAKSAEFVDHLLIGKAEIATALGHTPLVRTALETSNREFERMAAGQRQKIIAERNHRWMATPDAADPFVRQYIENPAADYFQNHQTRFPGEYGEIFLTNRYGALVASTAKLTTLAHAHKYWWQAAFNAGDGTVFFDDRGYDDSVGTYVLGLVVPVYDRGEIAGILKCNLNISGAVSNVLLTAKGDTPGSIKLARSEGDIVFEKGRDPLSGKVEKSLWVHLEKRTKGALLLDSNEPGRFVGYAPVKLTASKIEGYEFGGTPASIDHQKGGGSGIWYVIQSKPVHTVQALIRRTAALLFFTGLAFSGILAVVAFFAGQGLAGPIRKMAAVTREIAAGRFDRRIDVTSKDELGELSRSFNRMAEKLRETTASKEEVDREIKERMTAEAALKKSEEQYRSLFDNSISLIMEVNADTFEITSCNPAMANSLDLDRETLVGSDIRKFLPEEIMRKRVEQGERALRENRVLQFEDARAGRYFLNNFIPVFSGGRRYIQTVTYDITDLKIAGQKLKESEERYKLLFEGSDAIISLYDYEGTCLLMNKKTASFFGGEPEDLIGKSFKELHPEMADEYIRRVREVIENRTAIEYEDEVVFKDSSRWLLSRVHPVRNSKGEVYAAQIISQDITERKKAEKLVQSSLQEKELLLQELYHRTKNNMQMIVAMINFQARYIEDDAVLQVFTETISRIEAMALVHEKLYQTGNLSRIDLKAYFTDLIDLLAGSYEKVPGQIRIRTDMETVYAGLDTAIPCGLIMNELIANAFQHAFPETQTGEIHIRLKETNENEVTIIFHDDGAGMPDGIDIETADSMGLRTIAALAGHQLSGNVAVSRGNGTRFTITFQVSPDDASVQNG